MNLISKKKILVTALGVMALGLHLGMSLWGTDEKGLLISWHPLALVLAAVTVIACLAAVLPLGKTGGSNAYGDNLAPSVWAAVGCFTLAGGIAADVISGFGTWVRLEQIRNVLGILAIPALIAAGLTRVSGKQPKVPVHGLVCLYLMLHTVSHYQIWSSQPQWLNWFFPMAASVLLTLFSYQQAAFDVSLGDRRTQQVTGLLAVFFCIGAIARESGMLYLGGAIWALTNLMAKDDDHAAA